MLISNTLLSIMEWESLEQDQSLSSSSSCSASSDIQLEIQRIAHSLQGLTDQIFPDYGSSPGGRNQPQQQQPAHLHHDPTSPQHPHQHQHQPLPSFHRHLQSDREILEQFHLLGAMGIGQGDFDQLGIGGASNSSSTELDTIVGRLHNILDSLEMLTTRIIREEVEVYVRKQIRPEAYQCRTLEDIQVLLCEPVMDLAHSFQSILNKLGKDGGKLSPFPFIVPEPAFHILEVKFKILLEKFMRQTLVVDGQPPQVMKINTKFPQSICLRWLVGSKLVAEWGGRWGGHVQVKADMISETQAREIMASEDGPKTILRKKEFKGCGLLAGDKAKIELVNMSDDGKLQRISCALLPSITLCQINFRHLQLKKIDREIKKVKGQASSPVKPSTNYSPPSALANTGIPPMVTDEKFSILFHFDYELAEDANYGGDPLRFLLFSMSLPVVVVTHGVQESQGWATVTWDNSFSAPNRVPFEIPDRVPWAQIATLLSTKFEHSTGRGLDHRQLTNLRQRLIHPEEDHPDATVTFAKFAKEVQPGIGMSFWEWFYGSLKVTEKHALRAWKDGCVLGFISRKEAEKMLNGYAPGTFILRFSDTILGGISICYVASSGLTHSLMPFTTKNLTFRSLNESLWDLENLTTLYPHTPKVQAFPFQVEGSASSTSSINYSILKGLFAQQSHKGSSSSTTSPPKSSPTARSPRSSQSSSSSLYGYSSSKPIPSPKPESEYVECFPRISIPQQFV